MNISVCMATFNGEKYIEKQLESILTQISARDEVVLCDDGSSDTTLSIVNSFNDPRIRIFENPVRLGYVGNFERALTLSRGDHIFLSDQDDVWLPGRVVEMMGYLQAGDETLLVASNFDLIDELGRSVGSFRQLRPASMFRFVNIGLVFLGRMPYYGCTFLFKRKVLQYCLPIPPGIESHDIWIALIANLFGGAINIPGATLQHRIHSQNVTVTRRRNAFIVVKSRSIFFAALSMRFFKVKIKALVSLYAK
jgi:glycosyltransferase involved in cell wall biosynthesis